MADAADLYWAHPADDSGGKAFSVAKKGAFVQKLNNYLMAKYANFQADDEGQGVIEYVLVAGVISIALFVAFQTTGIATQISTTVGGIVSTMAGTP